MTDIEASPPPARAELLRGLRRRLPELVPGLRLVAEGILGADAEIDFVGIEPGGGVVLVLVGEAGRDLELVALSLAQRAWVEARLRDWAQLAPELGLQPASGVRVLLLAPAFRSQSAAAAAAVGSDRLQLASYRCVRNGSVSEPLVEALGDPPRPGRAAPGPPRPAASDFRSGLSDADLQLTPAERAEFE